MKALPKQTDTDTPVLCRRQGWTMKRCVSCRGTGTVDKGGVYGVVPGDCERCNGGVYWQHDDSGVRAMYPGGPFV